MAGQTVETYNYGKRAWYPHMMPEDVAVWERFIDQNPGWFESCEYDFPVGKVPDFVTADATGDAATMERLYKKKIDVVGKWNDVVTLIELKPICSTSTIGQILGYKHLYVRDIAATPEPAAMVICGEASEDVKEFAVALGVEVIVV